MNTTVALIDTENTAPNDSAVPSTHGQFTDRELTASEKDTIAYHLANSRSLNTRLAYENQWRSFVKWCAGQQDESGQGFVPFPAAPSTVILYLNHLAAEGHKVSKIEQAVSAIRAVHNDNINLLPGGSDASFTHPHIRAALSSIRRELARQGKTVVKKPRYFNQGEIKAMSLSCAAEGTPQACQDRAILLMLVNGGLRSSEVVSLRLSDIEIDGDQGVSIRITNSKTDQFGKGESVYVSALAPAFEAFDFTKSVREWIRYRNGYQTAAGDDSLFIGFRKGGTTPHQNAEGFAHSLSREAITTSLLRSASRAGLEPTGQTISSHSGRHTMVTTSFARGLDSAQISKTSRHRSLKSLMAYDQSSHKAASVSVRLWQ